MTYDITKNDSSTSAKDDTKRKTQPIIVPVTAAGSGGYATPRTLVCQSPSREDEQQAKNNKKSTVNRTNKAIVDKEVGGPKGPEPTRFGDWEQKGKCVDF